MPTFNPRQTVINPPIVGTLLFLPYPVFGNPWVDAYGYSWYVPNGETISAYGGNAVLQDNKFYEIYRMLWPNPQTSILGGKDATFQADWDAGKALHIPDCRGRSTVMAGQASGFINRSILSRWGTEQEILINSQMPSHNHPRNPQGKAEAARTYEVGGYIQYVVASNLFTEHGVVTTGDQGGNQPHNNWQPSKAMTELWALGV